ncbi:hypothetical protein SAMN05421810_103584 [Amycolatopsis arida]|uniref:Uncharacterized protein n=1 Tax=Amycolatopsis arida TaxID=587909 RepID=A0A1I5TMU9_9PSEU|nr:hypothetical protein CLV69_103173 [Amycolatopsis arida]SFP84370.1 hypothetical protein SAMN05421810_103584 [Amycolatopsis arida]
MLTATAIAAAVTGFSLLGGGTAAATTLAGSCSGTVIGPAGEAVAVDSAPVADIVRAAAKEKARFLNGVDPDKLANKVNREGVIPAGTIPGAGDGAFSGAQVAKIVGTRLEKDDGDGLGPWVDLTGVKKDTLEHIKSKVSGLCGLTLRAKAEPSSQPTPPQQGGTAGTHGGTPAPGATPLSGTGDARAPQRDYSGIPTASAGVAVPPELRYPPSSGVPGQGTPEFGILGADQGTADGTADIRNAGNADPLAAGESPNDVQLPMLLAVVALAGVTAALVRTWVLRRV